MREILFRGRYIDYESSFEGYQWISGSLSVEYGWYEISGVIEHRVKRRVIPETIGQYTGLNDKNGVRIFEGDIVCAPALTGVVNWHEACFFITAPSPAIEYAPLGVFSERQLEVVGNIYDNPELLKGGEV